MTEHDAAPVAVEQLLMLRRMSDHANAIAYNIMLRMRAHGPLDTAALRSALDTLVFRHHALRCRFTRQGDEWFQVVMEPRPAEMEIVDAGPGAAEKVTKEFVHRPFDISTGYLLRCLVIRTGPRDWDVVLAYHHLIMDAWSQRLLVDELAHLYTAAVTDSDEPLPPVGGQCADHARWQRLAFTPERQSEDLRYWLAELGRASQFLDLPTDYPRPPRFSGRGRSHEVLLPSGLVDELRQASARAGVTFFTGSLALITVLLWRLSKRSDPILSIPFFNREPAHERIITCTASPIFLRCDLHPQDCFDDLAARLGGRFFSGMGHRAVPTTTLLDALVAGGSWADRRPPSVAVALEGDVTADTVDMAQLDVRICPEVIDDLTHVDLLFGLRHSPEGLCVRLLYNADLFAGGTIASWGDDLARVLAVLVSAPRTPLEQLFPPQPDTPHHDIP